MLFAVCWAVAGRPAVQKQDVADEFHIQHSFWTFCILLIGSNFTALTYIVFPIGKKKVLLKNKCILTLRHDSRQMVLYKCKVCYHKRSRCNARVLYVLEICFPPFVPAPVLQSLNGMSTLHVANSNTHLPLSRNNCAFSYLCSSPHPAEVFNLCSHHLLGRLRQAVSVSHVVRRPHSLFLSLLAAHMLSFKHTP